MTTQLIEFNNQEGSMLRGILTKENDNDYIVVMVGGFEKAATTERKFKLIADKLVKENIASFRFDITDCGLSDGDFYNMTTESFSKDIISAIDCLKNLGYKHFSIIGHSLAACAIALLLDKISFEKVVLLAPALNQKDLLRLWFAQIANKDTKISWDNYKQYLSEERFVEDLKMDMIAKSHKLNAKSRQANQDIDYSQYLENNKNDNILLVHGDKDAVVPIESVNYSFQNKVIVNGGDHNLENPDKIELWINTVIDFLKN